MTLVGAQQINWGEARGRWRRQIAAELGISKHPNGGGRLACLLILYQPRLALQSQQSLKFCCHGLQLFRVLLSREGFDEGANTLFVLESQHNASIRAASGGGDQGRVWKE